MTKREYIALLEKQLLRLPKADRDDILCDYEAHFANGVETGLTEEEISAQLGDPAVLAANYLENLPAGSKGAPAQFESEPQNQYGQPMYYTAPNYQAPPQQTASKYNTDNLVIYILLCVFAFIPIAGFIISAVFGIMSCAVGLTIAGVGAVIAGTASTALNVTAGIGVVILALALFMLAALCVVGTIVAIKGVIALVKWFIKWSRSFILTKPQSN